jgi:hypothetical protein
MTIIVGNTERSELNAAVARARAHPVPWEVLRRVSEQDVEDQPLADEPPPPEFVDLPFGYVVAINNRRGRACTYRFRVRGRESRRIWSSAR